MSEQTNTDMAVRKKFQLNIHQKLTRFVSSNFYYDFVLNESHGDKTKYFGQSKMLQAVFGLCLFKQ
jgi:hypothetical protein